MPSVLKRHAHRTRVLGWTSGEVGRLRSTYVKVIADHHILELDIAVCTRPEDGVSPHLGEVNPQSPTIHQRDRELGGSSQRSNGNVRKHPLTSRFRAIPRGNRGATTGVTPPSSPQHFMVSSVRATWPNTRLAKRSSNPWSACPASVPGGVMCDHSSPAWHSSPQMKKTLALNPVLTFVHCPYSNRAEAAPG